MRKHTLLFVAIALLPIANLVAQCAQTSNIYTFTYGGHTYEIVKELKSWTLAKACAVERGGYLVSIDNAAEKDYIMAELMLSTAANIASNYHPVTDGGGASYIWTGGSDAITEGTWYWQGSPLMSPFYIGQGTAGTGGGAAVGGAYINWGCSSLCEPDNYFYLHDQDALGLAMGSWPYGYAGQWNDIDINNTLYFIIEKNSGSGIYENDKSGGFGIFPNPATDKIAFHTNSDEPLTLTIFDALGHIVLSKTKVMNNETIDIENLGDGIFFCRLTNNEGLNRTGKFIKQ